MPDEQGPARQHDAGPCDSPHAGPSFRCCAGGPSTSNFQRQLSVVATALIAQGLRAWVAAVGTPTQGATPPFQAVPDPRVGGVAPCVGVVIGSTRLFTPSLLECAAVLGGVKGPL